MGDPVAIGPYVDLVPLGAGGMGLVYRGRHRETGEAAAVKTVRVREDGLVQGLRREIQVLARIRHPGIVRILEHGTEGGMPWYAMQLLEGTTLRERLAEQAVTQPTTPIRRDGVMRLPSLVEAAFPAPLPLALQDTCTMVETLCHALAYLHGEGVVHGDLKPENVLVTTRGAPVLVDFGLVRRYGAGGREELDVQTGLSGTLAYMAPEQLRGEGVDARADLYALGVMLYELVTGRRPYADSGLLQAHLESAVQLPSSVVAQLPPEVEALILRLLEKEPRRRLGRAEDVARVLRRFGAARDLDGLPAPRAVLYQPRLLARDDPMARIAALVERVSSPARAADVGRGHLVLVTGPVGTGKTRLSVEAARLAGDAGFVVLVGSCPPGEDGGRPPLGALRMPLQQLADRCREHGAAESARLFGPRLAVLAPYEPTLRDVPGAEACPTPDELPEAPARLRLLHAATMTLEALTDRVPALLLLDDVHEADDLLVALLRSWIEGGGLARMRLIVLACARRGALPPELEELLRAPSVLRLEVEDLPEASVGVMASDMLATDELPPDAVAALGRATGGNPLLLSERLRAAVDDGLLVRDESGRWRVDALVSPAFLAGTGRGLSMVLAERLARLPPAGRRVAQARAILARDAGAALLARVARLGEADALDGVSELLRGGLFLERAPGLFGFANHATARACVATLAPDEGRAAHEAAARALCEDEGADRDPELQGLLARHWDEAGAPERARAAYLVAARQAVARHALPEAERLYRAAIGLARERDASLLAARLELGGRVLRLLRPPESAVVLAAALEDAEALGMAREAMEARLRSSMAAMDLGRMEEASRGFELALVQARALGDRRAEGNILGNVALFHQAVGRIPEARACFEAALRLNREIGNRREEGVVLGNLATLLEDRGEADAARELYEQALEIHVEVGNRRFEGLARGNLGVLWSGLGQLATAEPLLEESVRLLGEVGDRRSEATMRSNLALLRANQGRPGAARRVFLEVVATHHENGDPRSESIAEAYLANLERRTGDLREAERLLDRAQERLRAVGDRYYDAYCTIERAYLALARGDVASAAARVAELEAAEAALGAGREGPIVQALVLLHRGMDDLAAGRELWRGERPEALPPGLRAWVERQAGRTSGAGGGDSA